jgi:hypothetical protein
MSIHTNEERNAETDMGAPATPPTSEDTTEPTSPERQDGQRIERSAASEGPVASQSTDDDDVVLIDNTDDFRSRWESVQIGFVDDPRLAVQDAQQLLSAVVDELVDGFRRQLDDTLQTETDGEASTDQMRYTFRRYRVLFERLLTT